SPWRSGTADGCGSSVATDPVNGTAYRLSAMERSLAEMRKELVDLTQRFDQLDTHLTGAGVKGARGALGDVATELDGLANEVRDRKANLDETIVDEVRRQMGLAALTRQA